MGSPLLPVWLACSRASSTAVKMALEVTVAPEVASTPSVPLASMIAPGSCSIALEPMPCVSEFLPTSTLTMTPPSIVTVTGTLPPIPLPSAKYSPSAYWVAVAARAGDGDRMSMTSAVVGPQEKPRPATTARGIANLTTFCTDIMRSPITSNLVFDIG